MKLLDFYKTLSSNAAIHEFYFSTGGKNAGKVFSFINTNYRGILTLRGNELQGFAKGFRVMEGVEGKPRSAWDRSTITNQEKQKQHVVNMRQSELFRVIDDTYHKTSRGIVFKKMLDDTSLAYYEKKLICFLLLSSGYFSCIPNYIIEQAKSFFARCNEAGYSDCEILKLQKEFINCARNNAEMDQLFECDYLYLDSFYHKFNDIDFLSVYYKATIEEKEELKSYIHTNYTTHQYNCILAHKFKPGGNYTKNTVVDNAWMLFIAKHIIDGDNNNFDAFIKNIIQAYNKLYSVDENKIRAFIYNPDKNSSVFHVIYYRLMNLPIPAVQVSRGLTPEEIRELSSSDATDVNGVQALDMVSSELKKLAKLYTNYTCSLEECEMCKYFTSKESGKNYLEIHHFIPKEFANDFDSPIEILDNYVALCPNCHRKIHLAADNERKHMINTLYNQRKEKLDQHGLHIDLSQLYDYYRIDT